MRFADYVLERSVCLPPAENGYSFATLQVPMRDGVTLLTDHYTPATTTPRGTLLIRCPYGRGLIDALIYARPFARRGYHVLLQSVRGTFGSGGVFDPFRYDVDDAADTVAWLRTRAWFDGRLATIGLSYLGFTQWALMMDPPPELATAVVIAAPHDFGAHTWEGGAFNINDVLYWGELLVHQEDPPSSLPVTVAAVPRRIAKAFKTLPMGEAATDLLGRDTAPWVHDWLQHPNLNDDFWRYAQLEAALDRAQVPIMLIGGWHDLCLNQTLEQYQLLRTRGIDAVLTIGPWTHAQMVGPAAAGLQIRDALEWFTEHLGGDSRRSRSARVRVFVTGSGWRDLDEWPPPADETIMFPQAQGTLTNERPTDTATAAQFIYDPANPTPSTGGRLLSPGAGRRNDTKLAARNDVLCFDSAPLGEDLQVIGCPVMELSHTTDIPHADVFVRLSEVSRRGRSRNVGEGFIRLDPQNRMDSVRLQFDGIAHRFKASNRIRLLIAGGSHPRFARNLGTDEPLATATTLRPCTHIITFGESTRLHLPTVD
jgi:putative CocE/NonD family hydrolase